MDTIQEWLEPIRKKFFKNLWRKWFPAKSNIQIAFEKYQKGMFEIRDALTAHQSRPAYDPSTDEHKIMNGEVESYFD